MNSSPILGPSVDGFENISKLFSCPFNSVVTTKKKFIIKIVRNGIFPIPKTKKKLKFIRTVFIICVEMNLRQR